MKVMPNIRRIRARSQALDFAPIPREVGALNPGDMNHVPCPTNFPGATQFSRTGFFSSRPTSSSLGRLEFGADGEQNLKIKTADRLR